MRSKLLWLLGVDIVVTSLGSYAFSQERVIKGKIVDYELTPLRGVVVQTKDLKHRTSTDSMGVYSLALPSHYDTLQVSYVGLDTEFFPLAPTVTVVNLILFDDREEGYVYPVRIVRKRNRQEVKERQALYKRAKSIFNN